MAMVDSTGGTGYSSDSFEVEEEIQLSSETDSGSAEQLVPQSKMKTFATEQKRGAATDSADSKSVFGALQLQSTQPKGNDVTDSKKPLIQKHSDLGNISNQTLHSMQRVSGELNTNTLAMKSFRDSREVRDAVFSEWLAQKNTVMSHERVAKARERRQEKDRKTKKEAELAERASEAVKEWMSSKDTQLLGRQKQRREEVKKQRAAAEEKEQRKRVAELASHKWCEEKTKQYVTKHREIKKIAQEEERRKQEEAEEKAESAARALKVWIQRKDEVIKEERKKERQRMRDMELVKQEKAVERKQESKRAFEAWKNERDMKIKSTGTLYTYTENSQAKAHEKAWCPARSIKYDYLKRSEIKPKKTNRSESVGSLYSAGSASSYSLASDTASSPVGNSRPVSSEGKLKTIQVCCQTLEYWCTCDDH